MDLEGQVPADNANPDSYIYASGIRNTQGYDWFDDQHHIVVDHGPSGLELDMVRSHQPPDRLTVGRLESVVSPACRVISLAQGMALRRSVGV